MDRVTCILCGSPDATQTIVNGVKVIGCYCRAKDAPPVLIGENLSRLLEAGDVIKWAAREMIRDYHDQRVGNTAPWDCSLEQALERRPEAVARLVRAHVYGQDRDRLIDEVRD